MLLNDRVVEAAQKACQSADPFASSQACERQAVKSANPGVKAAIVQARASGAVN